MSGFKTHFGDPCIHCGIAFSNHEPGPCKGEGKSVPIGYAVVKTRWDGVEHYRVRFSDGHIEDRYEHVSSNAPYYHFGYSEALKHPPRYDERLKARSSQS